MSMATFPASLTARKSNPVTSVTCRPARAASTAASVAGSTPRSGAGRIRPTRPGASAEAPAKPGSISRMPSSTAATSAPSGPTVSMEDASGYTPSSGTRPQVVFRPAIPQQAAGIRTEPPVSVPRATSASPAATATAEPLDDPPGSRPGSSGFIGVPDHEFTPLADQHSSVRLVLPTIRAPARRAAATTGASAIAGLACSATTWHPAVVGRPSTSMQSLTASRGPSPGTSRRTIQVGSMEAILPKPRSHARFAWTSGRLRCRDLLMSHGVTMRVAIITESFPPDVNGRLATEKRVDLLAGIAALDGVRLVIVGAGPAEAALRQQLPGAVFLGQRRGEELAAIYASLGVFVHSGPYETFGQTLQGAAASGLPVVAPAAGGPLDLVEDEVTGYLVPPSDPGAFTAAVAGLAADPATRGVRRGRAAQSPRPHLARTDRGADRALRRRAVLHRGVRGR